LKSTLPENWRSLTEAKPPPPRKRFKEGSPTREDNS
jgi:hypothetical protein